MKNYLVLLCLVCCVGLDTQAQPRYSVRHLDHDNGLAHDRYNPFISTDARGFHWIGSTRGLYRFDGQALRYYPPPDGPGEEAMVQSALLPDRNGDLWYSTAGTLVRYGHADERLRPTHIGRRPAGEMGLHLFDYDEACHTLFVSDSEAIYGVDAADPRRTPALTNSESVRYLYLGSAGGARRYLGFPWLIRPGLELIALAEGTQSTTTYTKDTALLQTVVSGGARDHLGGVWLASDRGLLAYDPADDCLLATFGVPGASRRQVWDVARVDTLLFVASDEVGTWAFDPRHRRFVGRVSAAAGAETRPTDRPRAIHVAPSGEVLVMCLPTGVDVMVPMPTATYVPADARGVDLQAAAVILDREGQTWVLEPSGSIVLLDAAGGFGGRVLPKGEPNSDLGSFAADTRGSLWHVRGHYLYRNSSLRLDGWRAVAYSAQRLLKVYTTPRGGVYALTADHLLRLRGRGFEPVEGWRDVRGATSELFAIGGSSFALAKDDAWLRFVTLDEDRVHHTDSILLAGEIVSLAYEPTSGEALVGTTAGVWAARRGSNGEWATGARQLEGYVAVALAIDREGRAWVLTDRGLGFRQNEEWTFFTLGQGPLATAGIDGALVPAAGGGVWAGTTEGLVRAEPPAAPPRARRAAVYLRQAWVDERPVTRAEPELASGFYLPYGTRTLEISVGTVGFYDAAAPRIEHRLAGVQAEWQVSAPGDLVRLVDLAPDRHRLELRARGADDRVTPAIAVGIYVPRPYWETWWFRGLAVLGFATLVGAGVYALARRKTLRERARYQRLALLRAERDRIARELHDELGSGLATILFMTEDLSEAVTPAERGRIAALSRESLTSLRDIIWALDERDTSLRDLVTKVSAMVMQQCADRQLECGVSGVMSFVEEAAAGTVSAIIRRNAYLIVKEAVSNAVRHGGGRRVEVAFARTQDGSLEISIADDGCGFVEAEVRPGMGLGNLRRRATEIGGRVEIVPAPGAGTTITLTLPPAGLGGAPVPRA